MSTLVADGGSTKTVWKIDGCETICTQGINPIHQSQQEIERILTGELVTSLPVVPSRVEFYGAGCRGESCSVVRRAISVALGVSENMVMVDSDLVGAARALFGYSSGIACILGTGSNSGLYIEGNIVSNVRPLGYILGDEGSGAALGRMFLRSLLRGRLSPATAQAFGEWSHLGYDDIIDKVYRQPLANRFLASLSLFVGKRVGEDAALRDMVKDNFRSFFQNSIDSYGRRDLPVGAVGSIAWSYSEILSEVAAEQGYTLGPVIRSPL